MARPRRTFSSRGAPRGSPGAIRGSGRSVRPCHAWLGQATASQVPPIIASPGFPVAAARPKHATSPGAGCPLPRGGSAEGLHGGWHAAAAAPRPDGATSLLPPWGAVARPGGGEFSAAKELLSRWAGGGGFLSRKTSPPGGPTAALPPECAGDRRRFGQPLTASASRAPAAGKMISRARAAARPRGRRFLRGWLRGHPRGGTSTPDGASPYTGEATGSCPASQKREVARDAMARAGTATVGRGGARTCPLVYGRRRWPRLGGVLGRGESTEPCGRVSTGRTRRLEERPQSRPDGVVDGAGDAGSRAAPLGGAQPATLTFPRGGLGRAFHGISRTGVLLWLLFPATARRHSARSAASPSRPIPSPTALPMPCPDNAAKCITVTGRG